MHPLLKALIPLICSLSIAVADDDQFSLLFGEKTERVVDVSVSLLDFTRPQTGQGVAGTILFNRMRLIDENLHISFENPESIFDAKVYMGPNAIGVAAETVRFALKIDEQNFKYLDSFKWIKGKALSLTMDSKSVAFSSESFDFREPHTEMVAKNFSLLCDRHPDYSANDGDGFLAACVNFGQLKPKTNGNILAALRYFEEGSNVPSFDVKTKISELRSSQTSLTGHGEWFFLGHQDEVFLDTKNIKFDCAKDADIVSPTAENLLPTCLGRFNIEAEKVNFELAKEGLQNDLTNVNVGTNDEEIDLKFLTYDFKEKSTSIKVTSATKIKCKKTTDFNPTLIEGYFESCLNNSEISPGIGKKEFGFKFSFRDAADSVPVTVNLDAEISKLSLHDKWLSFNSKKFKVSIDHQFDFHLGALAVKCSKPSGMKELNILGLLETCKDDSEFSFPHVVLEDKLESLYYFIKTRALKVQNDRIDAKADALQIAGAGTATTLFNLKFSCGRSEESDLFNKDDLLVDCTENNSISIDRIVMTDKGPNATILKGIYQGLIDGRTNAFDPTSSYTSETPGLKEIQISSVNGMVKFKGKVRFLGLNHTAEIEGPAEYNRDAREIRLEVKKARLPLGIKSSNIMLFILRHFVVNEFLQVDDDYIVIKF